MSVARLAGVLSKAQFATSVGSDPAAFQADTKSVVGLSAVLVQETIPLLKASHLNFIGNVEGMDFFTGRADVIVCDGFVGNILMKFTEGLGAALGPFLEERLSSVLPPEELSRVSSDIWRATNLPRIMGGPLWGVNGAVVLGHGSCRAAEVAGAIDTAVRYVQIGLVESMRQELLVVAGQQSPSKLKAEG